LGIAAAFLLVTLISLIPLPPSIWSALPLRDEIVSGFQLIGMELPSLPVSLAPPSTIWSLLSLLPPAAMFLLAVTLPNEERRKLAIPLLAVAGVSIVLGAFQLFGGTESPLRPYAITNVTSPVGFFANVNHEGTLLLCSLPFVAFLAGRAAGRRSRSKRSGGAVISVAMALFLAVGIAISGSSAGYGLFLPTALASLLIYRRAVVGRIAWPWTAGMVVVLIVFAVAALRGPLSSEAFAGDLSDQPTSRRVLAATTTRAIEDSFPVGTGLGTFATVYRRYENPDRVTRQYANHAHNDYLEIVLELGVAGLLLILAFIAWWAMALVRVWRSEVPGAGLARAASVAVGVVLLHSIVDYPLRTAAIAALVALACALLVPAPPLDAEPDDSDESGSDLRHLKAE
ncbi:MAG TPA: O-antigen ligase family protein, partial [Allosphingosinicella sp.]|nr:O-antigen ligase family protein [Allosphingosinicella sp.]